jgi:hypothetical protein
VRGVLRRLLLDQEETILPALAAYTSPDLPVSDDFEDLVATANSRPASADQSDNRV